MRNDKQNECVPPLKSKYRKAHHLMEGIWNNSLVSNPIVIPFWVNDYCFWYERETLSGKEWRFVNARYSTNTMAFDNSDLSDALMAEVGGDFFTESLLITVINIEIDLGYDSCKASARNIINVSFEALGSAWNFDPRSNTCKKHAVEVDVSMGSGLFSPDGRYCVFTKKYNLWLRENLSGRCIPITKDGKEDLAYGAVGSAWGVPIIPEHKVQALWSPDGLKLFTVQRDTRGVKSTPFIHHVPIDGGVRPTFENIKVSYPGDECIESIRLIVIEFNFSNPESSRVTPIDYPSIPVTRNGQGFFFNKLGWWSLDSRNIYFIDMARDYKNVRVVECDVESLSTRVCLEERSQTQINLSANVDDTPMFEPLPKTNELLWYSEKSGWGHLYLYNLKSGGLCQPLTQGEWLVRNIVYVDHTNREVFLQTASRVLGRDPYYRDLVRINLDTGDMNIIISGNYEVTVVRPNSHHSNIIARTRHLAEASNGVAPGGCYIVVTRSRVDDAPVSLLLDCNGDQLLDLETANISRLTAYLSNSWFWPEPVKLVSDDGVTEIYGVVYRPSDFSDKNLYPIIDISFNSPDFSWVPKGSFINSTIPDWPYLTAAALAELGFIVVQIDGRGGAYRNKAFRDYSYSHIYSANNLADHVAGIKQLAERYPYIDLDRVGITTDTTDGWAAIKGLLDYPDFFKVGVSFGHLDNRLMSASMWDDKYGGACLEPGNYQYFEDRIESLQGKLLLMHGMLDFSCPPAAVFRIIERLHKSNKDFDMLLLPNAGHEQNNYFIRRAWDYFVRNLLGEIPPKEYPLTSVFK